MAIDPEILRLVQVTTRTFYEPRCVILMDQLVRKEAMRDEELAARVGLTTKDVAKIANKLHEDGFLASHRRNELRPGAMKASPRTWYYIDFQQTIDNIKWRMFKMRKSIDDELRNELDQQGYHCPRCKKTFSTLDAGNLLDFSTNSMRCDVCGTDVQDNENTEEVRKNKDKMNRLLGQTKPIVDGLRKTETTPLAAFHVAAWLEKHHPVAAADLLPTAESSGPAKVTVELVEGGDQEARRKKEEEAESKRQQNALPSWIERSTLTGELTAVGAAQLAKASGHDDSNKAGEDGLPSPKKATANADDDTDDYYASLAAAQAAAMAGPSVKREVSHANGVAEDDAASTQHGGSPNSSVLANGRLVDSGYEEFGDELGASAKGGVYSPYSASPAGPLSPATLSPGTGLPHAPSGDGSRIANGNGLKHSTGSSASLNGSLSRRESLLRPPSSASMTNSLGKRSREPSEESEGGKKVRTTGTTTPVGGLSSVLPAGIPARPALAPEAKAGAIATKHDAEPEAAEEEEEEAEDPILTVAGKEMRFSAITEEMTSDMTAEEYTIWWETLSTIG